MKKKFVLFTVFILLSSISYSQIIDTTLILNAKENCLLLSDTAKVNINSIVVGFEEGLEVNATYEVSLSGKAYFYYQPDFDLNPETSDLPLKVMTIKGIFLSFVSENGTEYKFLPVNESFKFKANRPFFYSFIVDRSSVEDNGGEFKLRIKKVKNLK